MKIKTKWDDAISGCIVVLAMSLLVACGGTGELEPVITISTKPVDVVRGDTVTVQWSATNATSCVASGDWRGARPTNGSEQIATSLGGKLQYKLTCTGPGGATKKIATVISHRAVSAP